jgi:hypothetical protein
MSYLFIDVFRVKKSMKMKPGLNYRKVHWIPASKGKVSQIDY